MKVSIIIPVYNVSDYIERCIKSVMNQTYSDIECIIVDDATPDDSIDKCERAIEAYNGPIMFSILHHQENRGLSAARNTGTNAATGEYLYYLDSDDEITSDCIEKLLKIMVDDNTIDMVQGNHIEAQCGKEQVYYKGASIIISDSTDIYTHYFKNHHIITTAWNKMMKRSFVMHNKLFFKEGILHEDRLWMFYLQKHLAKVCICKDITYIYHITPNSIITKGKREVVGNSYEIIYNEILNHLTFGREKIELNGYAYGFCKPYCMYLDEVPGMKDIFWKYKKQAKQYHCWYVYFILSVVGFVRLFGNPMMIMKHLHIIRWKLVELPDRLNFAQTK